MGFLKSETFLTIVLVVAVFVFFIIFILPMISSLSGGSPFSFAAIGLSEEGGSGIIRSQNGGDSWETIFPSLDGSGPSGVHITDIEFHPTRPKRLYVATDDAGLWRSTNLGGRWRQMVDETGLLTDMSEIHAIKISKAEPSVIYISTVGENGNIVLRSDNDGDTFGEIYRVPETGGGVVRAIAIDPTTSHHLFLGASDGALIETTDAGVTWKVIFRFEESIRGLYTHPTDSATFLAYMESGGVFETRDGGRTWSEVLFEIEASDVGNGTIMAIPQPEGEPVAIQNPFVNPFRLSGGGTYDFWIDPNNFSFRTAITRDGIVQTVDGGVTWRPVETLIDRGYTYQGTVATLPGTPGSILFGRDTNLYRSDNGGVTWKERFFLEEVRKLITHPTDPNIVFGVVE